MYFGRRHCPLGVTIPLTYLLLAPLGNWGAALLAG